GIRAEADVVGDEAGMPVVGKDHEITFAGFPNTREYGGTFRVTTLPGSMKLPAPIVTPLRMTQDGPIQTSSSIITAAQAMGGRSELLQTCRIRRPPRRGCAWR